MSILSRLYDVVRAHAGQIGNRRPSRHRRAEENPDTGYYEETEQQSYQTEEEWEPAPEPQRNDPIAQAYGVLELPIGANLDQVRQARKQLLRRYHPDKHASDPERMKTASEVSQQINAAYKTLEAYLK